MRLLLLALARQVWGECLSFNELRGFGFFPTNTTTVLPDSDICPGLAGSAGLCVDPDKLRLKVDQNSRLYRVAMTKVALLEQVVAAYAVSPRLPADAAEAAANIRVMKSAFFRLGSEYDKCFKFQMKLLFAGNCVIASARASTSSRRINGVLNLYFNPLNRDDVAANCFAYYDAICSIMAGFSLSTGRILHFYLSPSVWFHNFGYWCYNISQTTDCRNQTQLDPWTREAFCPRKLHFLVQQVMRPLADISTPTQNDINYLLTYLNSAPAATSATAVRAPDLVSADAPPPLFAPRPPDAAVASKLVEPLAVPPPPPELFAAPTSFPFARSLQTNLINYWWYVEFIENATAPDLVMLGEKAGFQFPSTMAVLLQPAALFAALALST